MSEVEYLLMFKAEKRGGAEREGAQMFHVGGEKIGWTWMKKTLGVKMSETIGIKPAAKRVMGKQTILLLFLGKWELFLAY